MRSRFASHDDSKAFPYRQLGILALCRIAEPIAFMSIFPYIYFMIESFHITQDDKRIALFAGLVTSSFAACEAMCSWIWGRASDRFGRKPILLCGLGGTCLSMLIFGIAPNVYVAIAARALGGILNGNIGVLQTTVAEIVKSEEHQAFAFASMPAIWCVGALVGSAIGGCLADPVRNYGWSTGTVWDQYPYLLPNLFCAVFIVICLTFGILFLQETHEDLADKKDYGLELGQWMLRKASCSGSESEQVVGSKADFDEETRILLDDDDLPPDYRSTASSPDLSATRAGGLPPPYFPIEPIESHLELDAEAANGTAAAQRSSSGFWNAMTPQVMITIVGYGILAYHTISAEQLLPVLFSMPESDSHATLPFWFTGGFGLPAKTIGAILSIQAVMQLIATIVVFPWVQRRIGTLATYRLVVLTYPLLYLSVPYLTLVPASLRMPAIYGILVWKVTAQAFAFPSNNIMLANATPKRALGTFNGISQSAASAARAMGPTLSGSLQAAGLAHGMFGLPWWFNAVVAGAGAILSLCMVEQKLRTFSEKQALPPADGTGILAHEISPEINAALVVAESSNAPADSVMSRPSSPLLARITLDGRRSAR